MVLEQLLLIFDIIIIIGIGICLDAIDGVSYTMYGKGGVSLLYDYRRKKIKARKEQRKQCKQSKISTNQKEE